MAEDVVAKTGSELPAAAPAAPAQTVSPAFEATSRRSLLPRISARRGGSRSSAHPELEPLLRTVKQFHPKADLKILELAYERAAYLHRDQHRRSGDPYITRPLAVATILALLPMSLGLGESAFLSTPLAVVVIGGLFTSTILTLILVPVLYLALDKLRRRGPEEDWTIGTTLSD